MNRWRILVLIDAIGGLAAGCTESTDGDEADTAQALPDIIAVADVASDTTPGTEDADNPSDAACEPPSCVASGCTPGEPSGCTTIGAELVCNAAGDKYDEQACPEGQWWLDGRP